jgi:catechol 2,3-dioxygenase-like lactoylglutathione lyase family enzyme/diadenosine tetraphosphate (Ap4A) HIT family hydrolase
MSTAIHRLVESCRAGQAPQLIARMPSGWAVMGLQQVLRGYSLLLPDPVVPHLNALDEIARNRFMVDLTQLGDAVLRATQALRINYAIFGNLEPALHAHVHPRYADEPQAQRTGNPWNYDWSMAPTFDERTHGELRAELRRLLDTQRSAASVETRTPLARLHHIDITVTSLSRATLFYDQWLTAMGFARIDDVPEGPLWRSDRFEFGLQQATSMRAHDRRSAGLHHIAFAAPSRAAVDQLHAQLCAAAVVVLDPPAPYEHYASGYYAVFFADPDGIKLEYVFTPEAPG